MAAAPQRIPFNQFIERLPQEAADEVLAAARIMLANEKAAMQLRGVEAELRPFFITAALSFVAGIVILLFYSQPGGFLDQVAGAWPILTAVLGFLPGLLAYYAIRIRKRSQADIQNFDLNKDVFLPHGAIYFPSDSDLAEQMVTMVEAKEPAPARRVSHYDRLRRGASW